MACRGSPAWRAWSGLSSWPKTACWKSFAWLGKSPRKWASVISAWPIIYAILLALPYFLLLIVYFAQVVISIFRVMMVAALSPILMLGFGFEWGRGMTFTAMRSLFASFMVLYGCTVALAVCLYGVAAMNVADPALTGSVGEILAFDNPTLLVAIALGWLGTAFMAEATGMANSIAGSQLTNTAAGVITAGATATGLTLLRSTFNRKTPGRIGKTAMGLVDAARYGIGAAKDPGGAMNAAGRRLSDGAQKIADRLKVPQFDDTTPKLEDNKRDDS